MSQQVLLLLLPSQDWLSGLPSGGGESKGNKDSRRGGDSFLPFSQGGENERFFLPLRSIAVRRRVWWAEIQGNERWSLNKMMARRGASGLHARPRRTSLKCCRLLIKGQVAALERTDAGGTSRCAPARRACDTSRRFAAVRDEKSRMRRHAKDVQGLSAEERAARAARS